MRQVILNLHGLGVPRHPLDAGEDRYWVGADLLAASIGLAHRHAGRVETLFTFDDGNCSDLDIGAPMLAEAGHFASFFVLANRIGQPHYLSATQIRALVAMGHRIGSHGADHVDWTRLDQAGIHDEMIEARDRIADIAGVPVAEAALPFGRYDANTLKQLRQAGYTRVYCSDGGAVRSAKWPVPRTSLTSGMTGDDVRDILLGKEGVKRRVRRHLSRVIKSRLRPWPMF